MIVGMLWLIILCELLQNIDWVPWAKLGRLKLEERQHLGNENRLEGGEGRISIIEVKMDGSK